ncbi:hypothetical protein ScPMuIL_017621 [Solemya velum]
MQRCNSMMIRAERITFCFISDDLVSIMPSNLSVMVLYTNDAVDVLYADKSMLQLSPCGTSFIHHASPLKGIHPLSGMRSIQQLSRYPTSEFQDKVIEALDFRNRFAEHPYLCSDFQSSENTVYQYAEIKKLAWPKELDVRSCDYFEDGGTRVTSMDQYGSLALSGHKQDFTVCYLSAISGDRPETTQRPSPPKSLQENKEVKQTNDMIEPHGDGQDRRNTPDENSEMTENLSISPISRTSNDSPSQTNQNVQEFQRFSTPTRELGADEAPVVTPYGKTAVFKNPFETSNQIAKAVRTGSELPNKKSSEISSVEKAVNSEPKDIVDVKSQDIENLKTRHPYMWVTKHYSCSEHPACWNHPVSLAKQASDQHSQNGPSVMRRSARNAYFPMKINPDRCVLTSIPAPIPLTCPGKHLHKLQLQQAPDQTVDILSWRRGKLKIILIDGVVYRIVRLPSMKFMEIYPGDGSVIVSQGLSGHIFTHSTPKGDTVEEKTYSAKTPIPAGASSTVSIQKLINRGYRFLGHANQEDVLSSAYDVSCWKVNSWTFDRHCSHPGLFSSRLQACHYQPSVRTMDSPRATVTPSPRRFMVSAENQKDLCRLFLPSGQYCMVDIKHPGHYSRYVEAAMEWVAWVNSTPLERRSFYQQEQYNLSNQTSPQKELEKINCFNYILDNTAFSTSSASKKINSAETLTEISNCSADIVHGLSLSVARMRSVNNSSHTPNTMSMESLCPKTVMSAANQNHRICPTKLSTHREIHTDSYTGPIRLQVTSTGVGIRTPANQNNSNIDQGFTSVRNALLQTSKCLSDIDDILSRRT